MITLREYLKGRARLEDMYDQVQENVVELLMRINIVRNLYGKPMIVTSGYRSPEYNKSIGGSANSAHCTGQAIDISCKDGKLKEWIKYNPKSLEELGFYFEDFDYTPTWVHFTIRPPKSGKRFFKP